jgi:hypothetical protein
MVVIGSHVTFRWYVRKWVNYTQQEQLLNKRKKAPTSLLK